MTFITWACLRYVQELTTILGPQNRTQGSCELFSNCLQHLNSNVLGRPGRTTHPALSEVQSKHLQRSVSIVFIGW